MSLISSLFKKKSNASNIEPNLYNVVEYDSLIGAQRTNVLEALRSKEAEAIYIKDAIDGATQKSLLDFFNALRAEKNIRLGTLDMFPTSFVTMMYQKEEPNDFFLNNQQIIKETEEKLGFSLENLILDLLTSLNGGQQVFTKRIKNGGGSFSPFQFRTLNKHKKTYNVHCENGQHEWAPIHNEALGSDKLQKNCIPFFITLQEANGGELALFDKKWESGQYTEPIDEFYNNIVDKAGERFDCSPKGIKRKLIDVNQRDLVLFNGGDIWHMVENVSEDRERITCGAFIEKGDDGNTYVWA